MVQSKESKDAGYDASKTGTYQKVNLKFDPTADFHEYRFDYVPGRVIFYADSEAVAEMEGGEMPSVGGHLILQHWSNGNPLWSGGPPEADALLTVSYVKAYFNSSDPVRLSERVDQCNAAGASDGAICAIPDVTAADASTGGHFFTGPRAAAADDEAQPETGDDDGDDGEAADSAGPAVALGSTMVLTMVGSLAMWLS